MDIYVVIHENKIDSIFTAKNKAKVYCALKNAERDDIFADDIYRFYKYEPDNDKVKGEWTIYFQFHILINKNDYSYTIKDDTIITTTRNLEVMREHEDYYEFMITNYDNDLDKAKRKAWDMLTKYLTEKRKNDGTDK